MLPISETKWNNCRKCKCNVIQSYNSMIADIFYPIFTLTITVLACFIREKKLFEVFAPTPSTSCRRGPGVTAPPSCNRFWLCQKPMRPYFFCIIPWHQRYSLIGKWIGKTYLTPKKKNQWVYYVGFRRYKNLDYFFRTSAKNCFDCFKELPNWKKNC